MILHNVATIIYCNELCNWCSRAIVKIFIERVTILYRIVYQKKIGLKSLNLLALLQSSFCSKDIHSSH